ncbi:hypothetical protein DFP92_1197 [Yoonia sediminilitoris]|uniref:Uncharacterized protein n=1 Tax=Yoonia sediminilitoris TaxID=1286148 RepID=A0A2T6K6V1_9RHOB|nr:hypothetical protein C8N45_1197 [Yoonia sediminilitoris]RCW89846.1 hypothetical protein DFP92_1197 [Yoonia sediminilitoris]
MSFSSWCALPTPNNFYRIPAKTPCISVYWALFGGLSCFGPTFARRRKVIIFYIFLGRNSTCYAGKVTMEDVP